MEKEINSNIDKAVIEFSRGILSLISQRRGMLCLLGPQGGLISL